MMPSVSGTLRTTVVGLIANRPGITSDQLVGLVYADRPNGEPDWAVNSVKSTIHHANKELLPQGYLIRCKYGQGYRLIRVNDYRNTAGMLAGLA